MSTTTIQSRMNTDQSPVATINDPITFWFNQETILTVNKMLRIFKRRGRIRVMMCIRENPGITQTAIQRKLKWTYQSEVSQATADLAETGVIIEQKEGKYVHYTLNDDIVDKYIQLFEFITNIKSDADKIKSHHR